MKTLFTALLFSASLVFASDPTDIKTKTGIWINVQIIDSTDLKYIVKTSSGNRTIYKESIIQILYSEYDSLKASELFAIENSNQLNQPIGLNIKSFKTEYEQPYLLMLPLTVAFGYLSYDYFKSLSDINSLEDKFNDLGVEIDYKDQKTRYTIGGVVCLIAAITNTIFALKSVQVTGTNNSIGLSYNF